MATSRKAKASKHTLKEPAKPEFPALNPTLLAQWSDAVADYARALNNMGWFAAPADEREGRLFLEEIPGATPELKEAQSAINNLLVNPGSRGSFDELRTAGRQSDQQAPLIEAFESCIMLSFPAWKPIIKHLKKQKLEEFKASPPTIKNKIYFFLGRYIADVFCAPIQQSPKWELFLTELSQKIHDHLSSELTEKESPKLIAQQVTALGTMVLGAATYCLLKSWNDLYVPKAEEGTPEGHLSMQKQQTLNYLLQPLSATFSDSPAFLLNLLQEYKRKKVSITLLELRINITAEIDDLLIKYVHKTEDLGNIKQLKAQLKTELEEKLREMFSDKTVSDDEIDDNESLPPPSLSPPPSDTRTRARSGPATLGVKPFLLSENALFRKQQASTSDKTEESKTEPDSANQLTK